LRRVPIGERLEHVAVLDSGEAVAFVVPNVFVAGIALGRGAIGEPGKQIGDQWDDRGQRSMATWMATGSPPSGPTDYFV
jgi:hypothetical protein